MGKISEKNLRYRTKEQMTKDVHFILNAPVSYAAKYAVLHEVTWIWTEFHGKHLGCKFWSKAALKLPRKGISKLAIHEHLVPRRIVISRLIGLSQPSHDDVFSILDRYLIGVVITNEENARLNAAKYGKEMPPEFYQNDHPDFDNPWIRYQKCNIAYELLAADA